MGLTFLTISDMFINMTFGQVTSLPQIYPVYKREISNNMYNVTASYFARVAVSICTFFFYPFLLTLFSIWFYSLPYMGIKGFCEYWGILTIMAFVGSSFGMTMGCIVPDSTKAMGIAQLFVMMFNMGAGFLQNTSNGANPAIRFLSWVSPMHYACELMLGRILAGRDNEAVN